VGVGEDVDAAEEEQAANHTTARKRKAVLVLKKIPNLAMMNYLLDLIHSPD
jgi:hypothetical protein